MCGCVGEGTETREESRETPPQGEVRRRLRVRGNEGEGEEDKEKEEEMNKGRRRRGRGEEGGEKERG